MKLNRNKRSSWKLILFAATLSTPSLYASHAMAQTQVNTDPLTTDPKVEEVVVTARKSSERLQDVPLNITAFNTQDLQDRGIGGLKDIAQLTPGFVFQSYSSSFDASPTIRGLTQFDVTSSVANVSTVVNNVYLPRNYSVDLGIGDISQIEIVKGPQSALYGSNAFAGVISYTLTPPPSKPSADFTVTGGTAGRFDYKVDAGTAFFNGKLAVRGYYASTTYDGTWKNNFPGGGPDLGGYHNTTYGGAVRFEPISQVHLDVNYFHLDRHEDIKPAYNIENQDSEVKFNCGYFVCGDLSTNPDVYRSATSLRPSGLILPPEDGFTSGTDYFSTQLMIDITKDLHVTYLFGHVRSYATEITASGDDPVNGPPTVAYTSFFPPFNFTFAPLYGDQKEGGINQLNSHELRLDYQWGHLKALLGFYYSTDQDTYEFNIWQVPNGQGVTGGDPTHPEDFAAFPFALLAHHETTDTTAEFGRLSYGLFDDRLTLAGEVRHSSDDLTFTDKVAKVTQKANFDKTTPRFTADYKLTPDSLLYASAAEGVKEGGFNGLVGASGAFTLLPSQQTFAPETNWTYEIGSKNTFWGGRALVNADFFYVDWANLQIQEQPSNTPAQLANTTSVITTNLGGATSYGVESNGLFSLYKHVDLTYALALIDPTFKDGVTSARFAAFCTGTICPANTSVAGNTLPRTSKVQAASGATYKDVWDGYRWNAHIEFTYQSQQEAEEMNITKIPDRFLVNGSIGVKGQSYGHDWDLTIWGKNIFNEKYVADSFFTAFGSSHTIGYGVSLGEKATAGVTFAAHY